MSTQEQERGNSDELPQLLAEKWECNVCGLPCRIEITYTNSKIAHLEDVERFRDRRCPCKEDRPEWVRIS